MHYSRILCWSTLLASATLTHAHPKRLPGIVHPRVVDELNEEATAEAHQRDNTATRAFSSITITTSDGQCLFVDPLSGDFRANLLPIQSRACDGGDDQKWDIITAGLHNDQPGTMLIVSALTQGCMNYDPRRQPGDQVNIFSCGGRAAGEGRVTNSQLFSFPEVSSGPLALQPLNEAGTCVLAGGARLDKAACNTAAQAQLFTFGAADSSVEEPPTDDEEPEVDDSVITSAGASLTADEGFSTIPSPDSTIIGTATTSIETSLRTTTAFLTVTTNSIPALNATTTGAVDATITEIAVVTTTLDVAPTITRGPGRGRGRGRGRGGRGRGRGRGRPIVVDLNGAGRDCPDKNQ